MMVAQPVYTLRLCDRVLALKGLMAEKAPWQPSSICAMHHRSSVTVVLSTQHDAQVLNDRSKLSGPLSTCVGYVVLWDPVSHNTVLLRVLHNNFGRKSAT